MSADDHADRNGPWADELGGIAARRQRAGELGGREAVEARRVKGRLTVRDRIEEMVDPGSFHEQGPIAGHGETDAEGRLTDFAPANYVLGLAKLDGRPCVVGGEDFTQRGGSPSPAGLRKSVYAESLAVRMRVPLIRFLEGGGGSVSGPAGKGRPAGDPVFTTPRFRSIGQILGIAPVASAALGAVAGFPAARLVASHFSVMTRENSQVMIGGPALVARALGESLTKDELGGAKVHARSGVVDNIAEDEHDAFAQMRRFLSYMPTNVSELPPVVPCEDDTERTIPELRALVPRDRRKVYDTRRLLRSVLDRDTVFELTPHFGRSQVTALARLGGRAVGVLANDCRFYAGAMTADGAQKVRRFVDLCDTFHLPIVSFVDEPGFMIGPDSERDATIRHGAAALFAVQQSRVPWISVVVRKSYGVAAAAHYGPDGIVLAWPSAESGALPLEGGIAVAYRREIADADDPAAKRAELEESWASKRSPFPRAEAFAVHDLIDPADTRRELCRWIDWHAPLLNELLGPASYTYRP